MYNDNLVRTLNDVAHDLRNGQTSILVIAEELDKLARTIERSLKDERNIKTKIAGDIRTILHGSQAPTSLNDLTGRMDSLANKLARDGAPATFGALGRPPEECCVATAGCYVSDPDPTYVPTNKELAEEVVRLKKKVESLDAALARTNERSDIRTRDMNRRIEGLHRRVSSHSNRLNEIQRILRDLAALFREP